jgi:hypothetical protein
MNKPITYNLRKIQNQMIMLKQVETKYIKDILKYRNKMFKMFPYPLSLIF